MMRMLSYLIAVISIVSALTGLASFGLDHGALIKQKAQEIIALFFPRNPSCQAEQEDGEPADCSVIPALSERIVCINKKKEREERAKAHCPPPIKGHAVKA